MVPLVHIYRPVINLRAHQRKRDGRDAASMHMQPSWCGSVGARFSDFHMPAAKPLLNPSIRQMSCHLPFMSPHQPFISRYWCAERLTTGPHPQRQQQTGPVGAGHFEPCASASEARATWIDQTHSPPRPIPMTPDNDIHSVVSALLRPTPLFSPSPLPPADITKATSFLSQVLISLLYVLPEACGIVFPARSSECGVLR